MLDEEEAWNLNSKKNKKIKKLAIHLSLKQ